MSSERASRTHADTDAMDWQPSPSPTVWRKRLEHSGSPEQGRVTSIVRFDAGSRFHGHPHPEGEEILVLDGVFSDETGDYPAGSYLLNPEGFEHAPFSEPGCRLFVKLRQYPGLGRRHVTLSAATIPWRNADEGLATATLYAEDGQPESMTLLRLAAGTPLPLADGGNELFVLSGDLVEGDHRHGTGTWLRLPAGEAPRLVATNTSVVYRKSGHLA